MTHDPKPGAAGTAPVASEHPGRVRRHRMLIGAGALALVLAVLLVRGQEGSSADDEALQAWAADLDAWAHAATEQIGPDAAPGADEEGLAQLFDPAWAQPVRYPDQESRARYDDVDAVNAACTAATGFIAEVTDAIQPPAPPPGIDLDTSDPVPGLERFSEYRRALAEYQDHLAEPEHTLRTFCGTYPATLSAHADAATALTELERTLTCDDDGCTPDADADADEVAGLVEAALVFPNERIGASLSTQCHVAELAQVCAADAAEAADLAQAWQNWEARPGAADDDAVLTAARKIISEAESQFPEVAADVGGDRAGAHEAGREALAGSTGAITTAAADFAHRLHGAD